jgi:hypothetical protein
MLPFFIEKYLLFILFRYKKRSCMKKINVIVINMKTSDITWKIVILQKIRKRINKFGVTMTEKHYFQILIVD